MGRLLAHPLDIAATDALASARVAGLTYVAANAAGGLARRRLGAGFRYLRDGRAVRDEPTLRRVRALAIPPAWRDVWICADPNGHLQATGRDARGRKQYRYHARWRAQRDETKFERVIAFGKLLPRLRGRVARDMARPGLPREKVIATIVRLLETTLIRVGNDEYARDNHSFGLTTLQDRHVAIRGSEVRFHFRGKSGKQHEVTIDDPRVARVVKRCRDIPGYELFQYVDQRGQRQVIDSADVNRYIHAIAGEAFTAKDFRTWAGTVLAALSLGRLPRAPSRAGASRKIGVALEAVARRLGNTRVVCRKSYVHPAVLDCYVDGELGRWIGSGRRWGAARARAVAGLADEETAVLAMLENRRADDSRDNGRGDRLARQLRRSLHARRAARA